MPKTILLDEIHVSLKAPHGLPPRTYSSIYRTLRARQFQTALGRAIRQVFRRYPTLRDVRVILGR